MIAGKNDNAWVSGTTYEHLECTKCGPIGQIRGTNDREIEQVLFKHLREKHGGVARGC